MFTVIGVVSLYVYTLQVFFIEFLKLPLQPICTEKKKLLFEDFTNFVLLTILSYVSQMKFKQKL